ncbi:hypothetical protein BCR43DRAFT_279390 [Syncephalastrum racemosum]|uniref:Uncharacterized protein n=1 Tax=Syncephalastrum racemosum TaxID=13706 RepID=A0A1X2HCK6_SYNRA|nr:hypothetical protein BCR43DRAFT_279390 [Syncephalastrum racemosum]
MDDPGSWLVALFVNKVLIPALRHAERLSPDQIDSLCFALSSVLKPSHYTERTFHLRVLTMAITHGQLLTTLVPHLLQPHSRELEHILIDIVQCEPPYTYPVSAYLSQYSTPLHSELSRPVLVERITNELLMVPFVLDCMEDTTLSTFAASLPLGAVLDTIVQSFQRDTAWLAPEAVAGLLINTTQLANVDSEKHFEKSLDAYATAMPLLLTHLSNNYLIDPVKEAQKIAQDDSDYSDSEEEEGDGDGARDVVMADASALPPPDPKIAQRLESLYDATKISSIVRSFMHRATESMQTETVVASLAHLLNSLMIRWPSKKDDLLNHLLYHRWWTGSGTEAPVQLPQVLWETWLASPCASVFDKDDKLMGSLDAALRTVTAMARPGLCSIYSAKCTHAFSSPSVMTSFMIHLPDTVTCRGSKSYSSAGI